LSSNEVVKHVVGITITRDGLPVATVSTYTVAVCESKADMADIQVTGDVSQTSGELGFLDLVWYFPSSTQVGEYECTSTCVTDSGHFVTLNKTLQVRDVKGSSLDVKDMVNELKELKNMMYLHNISLAALKKEMEESRHVEVGYLRCGDSNSWDEGSPGTTSHNGWHYYALQKHMSQNFKKNYNRPPVVFLSTSYILMGDDQTTYLGIQLLTVDELGFSIRCGTASRSSTRLNDLEIQWVSIPA